MFVMVIIMRCIWNTLSGFWANVLDPIASFIAVFINAA